MWLENENRQVSWSATKRQVATGFFFILIGGKGGVGSPDQSHNEGGRSHALLLTLHWKLLYLVWSLGNNVAAAAPALERLGAEGPFDPGFHGSYAFSGCTGPAPRFYTKAEVRPRYHGPAIVAQLIPTPAAQKGSLSWFVNIFRLLLRAIFRLCGSLVDMCTCKWES